MTYNLTGINFHKPMTSNANNKNFFVTGTNQGNELRSSSAFDHKRNNIHSSPNSKGKNPFNLEEKNNNNINLMNKLKIYDYIPKINKEKKPIVVDPVTSI